MRIAIVGCGLIGRKRARALGAKHELVVVADTDLARAEALARDFSAGDATQDWKDAVGRDDVEAVIIATPNNVLPIVAVGSALAGKHVLVEKPAGRIAHDLDAVKRAATDRGVCVRVGFNHRFHPAILKAREIFETGELGELMFIRARYGHGGRIGYDKEWRADPEISGGGELIDQGCHLVDLSRWFLGEFVSVAGHTPTYFWNMPVDDNAFLSLRTAANQTAWLHASCTEWKNMFSFEIYGRNGKLAIDGLGGSYGVERLAYYKMLPEMGPPETTIWEYPGEDRSWAAEFEGFVESIAGDHTRNADLEDAQVTLEIIEQVYQGSI